MVVQPYKSLKTRFLLWGAISSIRVIWCIEVDICYKTCGEHINKQGYALFVVLRLDKQSEIQCIEGYVGAQEARRREDAGWMVGKYQKGAPKRHIYFSGPRYRNRIYIKKAKENLDCPIVCIESIVHDKVPKEKWNEINNLISTVSNPYEKEEDLLPSHTLSLMLQPRIGTERTILSQLNPLPTQLTKDPIRFDFH